VSEPASIALPWPLRIRAALEAPYAAPLLVGVMMLTAFAARVLLAQDVLAPWAQLDELQYAEAARSFLSGGHYLFRDEPHALRTIYPVLISPAWLAGSVPTAYTLIKVINSALMVAGAIPLYLWSRRLVAPLWGVLVVALYLAMPGFIYTAEILTENAYVPATVLALFAIAVAIERPSIPLQLLAFGAILLAAAARIQGVILLPALFTAIGVAVLFDGLAADPGTWRKTVVARLRRFWPSLAVPLLVLLLYAAYERARGQSLESGLGVYQNVAHVHYVPRDAASWALWHFGELALSVGILPVSALIVLAGLASRRASAPKPAERAFLAVTAAAVFWIVVQAGIFASHYSLRIEERLMFNVTPALFLALVVWLARGVPRPPRLTFAAVLVPVAFLLVLPYTSLLGPSVFNDTFGLIPVWRMLARLGNVAQTQLVVAFGAIVLGLLFATVSRRFAIVLVPATTLVFLVLSTNSVFGTIEHISSSARHAGGLPGDPSWVDDAIGKDKRVEVLYTSDFADPHVVWQAEFWNRSVRRVFGVTSQDPSIPDVSTSVEGLGRIVPVLPATSADRRPRYVLAAKGVAVEGAPIASGGQLVLWRVRPPLRLTQVTSGITPDGWTGSSAAYTVYNPPPGTTRADVILGLPLGGIPPAHVQATVGPLRIVDGAATQTRVWATRKTVVGPNRRRVLTLPVRRGPFQVILAVSPTFSPSQFGSPDTRTLGVQARLVFG
jgi:hypothetical protein